MNHFPGILANNQDLEKMIAHAASVPEPMYKSGEYFAEAKKSEGFERSLQNRYVNSPMVVLEEGIKIIPEHLIYRNEYPTEPGWYWCLRFHVIDDGESIEGVVYVTGKERAIPPQCPSYVFYAGPITPPERPKQ